MKIKVTYNRGEFVWEDEIECTKWATNAYGVCVYQWKEGEQAGSGGNMIAFYPASNLIKVELEVVER